VPAKQVDGNWDHHHPALREVRPRSRVPSIWSECFARPPRYGAMFTFERNRLCGSSRRLTARSRS
jgi:hypothetical protein